MSSSESQNLSGNRRRDSYEDRICDDLSEVILQYLPIEDKFDFECVSKQFQRTVFQRHYELHVGDLCLNRGLETLEVAFRKLSQIRSVKYHFCMQLEDSIIETILKNCDHLVDIDLNLSQMSETTQQLLVEKFGPKLVSFTPNSTTIGLLDKWFPNLNETKLIWSPDSSNSGQQFGVPVSHQKKMTIECCRDAPIGPMSFLIGVQQMVERNPSLTHLTICNGEEYFETEEVLALLSQQISQLSDLVSFELKNSPEIGLLAPLLERLSLKCVRIKSLDLSTDWVTNEADVQQFMSLLKKFKRLTQLSLEFSFETLDIERVVNESFKTGFEGLTHLKLTLIDTIEGSDYLLSLEHLFTDLAKYCPQLRHLDFQTNAKVRDESAAILNQFSRLECLSICCKSDEQSLKDSIETEVTKNCINIRSIHICMHHSLRGETEEPEEQEEPEEAEEPEEQAEPEEQKDPIV